MSELISCLTYDEAYRYIIRSYSVGAKHDKSVLTGILEILENPHLDIKTIHVAGTNGKGSVCAYLLSVLNEAGYSVGMYTSPHLHRFNERFILNGQDISDDELAKCVSIVKYATNRYFDDEISSLSYFELLTVCAFVYFREKMPDYVILEVGIGGRLDATNVIQKPIVSVITSIGFDHKELLGDTIKKIAYEKAGIIKKNCPTVLYLQTDEVYNVIKDVCKDNNSVLYYPKDLKIKILQNEITGIDFSVSCAYFDYECISISLLGKHQIYNASTALLAINALRDAGVIIPDRAVMQGMFRASWNGRMEIIHHMPTVILDGAHNIDGTESFHETILEYFKGMSITVIIAILKGKDFKDMMRILTKNPDIKNVILTQPAYKVKATSPQDLEPFVDGEKNTYIELDYIDAIKRALDITTKDGVICCVGSLYLVGDVRKYFVNKKA